MEEDMMLNATLSAGVRGVETGADAAPVGVKKYVRPTCKVFPLDCQLLAASGPIDVVLRGYLDYYLERCGEGIENIGVR